MSETKFTKGEWEASQVKANGVPIDKTWSVGVGGFLIADVTSGATFGIVDEIQKANANLIAAAPNGFALGKLVMDLCGQPHGISEQESDLLHEEALEFIKKCNGES